MDKRAITSNFFSDTMKDNTTNIILSPIDSDNPGCLVEKKYLDILRRSFEDVSFEAVRTSLIEELQEAQSITEMKKKFNDATYLYEVYDKMNKVFLDQDRIKYAMQG